jgi:Tfp pilus assembly protein PilF
LALLADFLKDPGRRKEAEEIRRRVILVYETLKARFPDDPEHRRNLVRNYIELARLLWELGRQTEAAELYRKVLELDPDNHAVNNDLAWFLATSPEPRWRDAALAVRLAKKAVTAQPECAIYRNTLGVAYHRSGDDRAAVAELETSTRLGAGGNSLDWFFLAMAHQRLGDRDKARMRFDRAVQWMDRHKPRDEELCRFRAEAETLLAGQGQR